jgi:hypothetical protein
MPIEKFESGAWPHPVRLPLGCGWRGQCSAPGHDGEMPSDEELQDFCNLGYAEKCPRLPRERSCDSVRFGIYASARTSSFENGSARRIQVRFVYERQHLPAGQGVLEFDPAQDCWIAQHPDARVQRMADCFLKAYLERARLQIAEEAAS